MYSIENAYGDAPPPHVFWHLAKETAAGDVCHVFGNLLGSAWQTLRSVHSSGSAGWGRQARKKTGRTFLGCVWLGVAGQRNQKKHAKNNYNNYGKISKHVTISAKK